MRPTGAPILILCVVLAAAAASARSAQHADMTRKGNAAMAEGRYDEAAAIYAELARALPREAGILLNLGMAQSMAGRPREAIAPLERAAALQPSLHAAWLFLGSAYLETGRPALAVKPLVKAAETDPRSTRARQMLAEAYLSLQRYRDAEGQLEKILELDPNNANAWYALGQSPERRAQRAFEALQQAAPGSVYETLLAADVLASQGEYEQAAALYRGVLHKIPTMRAAQAALADVYELAGNAAGAAEERRKLDAFPEPDCGRAKAECEFLARRYREAVAATAGRADPASQYWRAMAHNELALDAFSRLERLPPSPESHAFRAELYRHQGRHLDSASELRKAAALTPGDRRIQRELATSLYLSRDYAAAEPLLRELLQQDPKSAALNFMYGDTLLQQQKADEALPPLAAAARSDPGRVDARASLGRAYLQLGRAAEAIPHLKAALEGDEDGGVHYQLARAYQAVGELQLAKEMMAKYAAIEKARRR